MCPEELQKNWNELFPDELPIAHQLMNGRKDRWLRIHALPQSKRYPVNEEEYQIVLSRHNRILSDLLGSNNCYYLLTTDYSFSEEDRADKGKIRPLRFKENFWLRIKNHDIDYDEIVYTNIYFDENRWHENSLDKLLRLVAGDEIGNVMLFSVEKKIFYHPYDGGADIIFENGDLRDFYKNKYTDWLPMSPSGL